MLYYNLFYMKIYVYLYEYLVRDQNKSASNVCFAVRVIMKIY